LRKGLIAALLVTLMYNLIAVPVLSTEDCVKISVQDSRGVRYVNFDIYAEMNFWGSPDYIGKTGKDGWLSWCDYISAPLGYPYKLVAKEDGCQRGSTFVLLFTGDQTNIVIPMTDKKSDVGGINFTSIGLNYISVSKNGSDNINFDYIFKAQKANGTRPGIGFNDSTSLAMNAFMTGLAVDDDKFRVNLNPREPNDIIDQQLRESDVGRIMLEADFQMKSDFSYYENPCTNETGKAFWNNVDKKRDALIQRCMDKYPGEILDIDNVRFGPGGRLTIVPDKIFAYINGTEIYIINALLTIESESCADPAYNASFRIRNQDIEALSEGCIEELNRSANEYGEYYKEVQDRMIMPYVVADVNHGRKYEDLRNIYVALALAQWYKTTISPDTDIRDRIGSPKPAYLKSLEYWSPEEIWEKIVYFYEHGEYQCWENTTTETSTGMNTVSRQRLIGGVVLSNIRDRMVVIDQVPPEINDQIRRVLHDGFIDEGNYMFFGASLPIGPRTILSGSSSESATKSQKILNSNINETSILQNQVLAINNLADMKGDHGWIKTFGGNGTDIGRSVQRTSDGGYIIAGLTSPYGADDKDVLLIKTDSSGNKEWDKTFGGSNFDRAFSVQETSDGSYIIAGETESYGAGNCDIWLIKTDSSGDKEWDRTYGAWNYDRSYSVQQTSDGGYVVGGSIDYSNGMVACLIKIDANGNDLWLRTFNGSSYALGKSVRQTDDSGYILAGLKDQGVWLIKTDSSGNEVWDKTFAESGGEGELNSVQQTKDGGYIIAGRSPGAFEPESYDVWLIKTDSSGKTLWNKTFGGPGQDWANSVQQTSDGGYIVAGNTWSYGGSNMDAWLIKTDAEGNKIWNKVFSGTNKGISADQLEQTRKTQTSSDRATGSIRFGKMNTAAYSVQQTSDGGYIAVGETSSYGPGTGENPFGGGGDIWLIKIDANGNM
jgi:hypothetical protein